MLWCSCEGFPEVCIVRLYIHGYSLFDLLHTLNNDSLTRLQSYVDYPARINPFTNFNRPDINFIVRCHNCHLIAALKFRN